MELPYEKILFRFECLQRGETIHMFGVAARDVIVWINMLMNIDLWESTKCLQKL